MNRRSQKLQEELIQKRLNDALKEIDRLKAQDIDTNKIIEETKLRSYCYIFSFTNTKNKYI